MKRKLQKITKNFQETQKFGLELSQYLVAGQIIALQGDLGAGKTTFLQGLASGLGIKEIVNSPTFNILKRYNILSKKIRNHKKIEYFYHIDTYRLHSSDELLHLGWEEIIQAKNYIIAIEWAEKVSDILPRDIIVVNFQHIKETSRKITISLASGLRLNSLSK